MSQSLATVKKNVRVSWQQDSNGQEKETVQRVTDLPHHESQFLLLVVGAPLYRDYDYQTLNLTFAADVMKTSLFASLFPKPLERVVSFHACYRNFPPKFSKKLNLPDL
ncbi:hypothetical protein BGY98DRAFT_974739 [Russula aff. rugulosa BPL654]|nr:hypothetical protein BGY98DRAFT_974739 [Russula aff. rugulosa BPL654]